MPNLLPPLGAAAVALCLATACVTQEVLPSRPSRNPDLEIRGTTLLMPGARGRLTAWLPGNGQVREVRARWAAEGDAVSITTDGIVTGRRLGQATVRAFYEDLTGVVPVQVVASVAGNWRGSITVVDCWQTVETAPDPCERRRGLVAPLVLNVTQNATADLYDNLRATVDVFTPPARGSFIGAFDSSGLFFLDGNVERPIDSLSGAVRFRWMLENNQLVPFTIDGRVEDSDVQLSLRVGATTVLINEIWKLSTMVR
jgi:hypothetical protein